MLLLYKRDYKRTLQQKKCKKHFVLAVAHGKNTYLSAKAFKVGCFLSIEHDTNTTFFFGWMFTQQKKAFTKTVYSTEKRKRNLNKFP